MNVFVGLAAEPAPLRRYRYPTVSSRYGALVSCYGELMRRNLQPDLVVIFSQTSKTRLLNPGATTSHNPAFDLVTPKGQSLEGPLCYFAVSSEFDLEADAITTIFDHENPLLGHRGYLMVRTIGYERVALVMAPPDFDLAWLRRWYEERRGGPDYLDRILFFSYTQQAGRGIAAQVNQPLQLPEPTDRIFPLINPGLGNKFFVGRILDARCL